MASPGNQVTLAIRIAGWAGTLVRLLRILFAPAAAVAVAIGVGEVAGHIWYRGLSGWVALAIGGGFGLWIASEINAVPPPPPRPDDDAD